MDYRRWKKRKNIIIWLKKLGEYKKEKEERMGRGWQDRSWQGRGRDIGKGKGMNKIGFRNMNSV